LLFLLCCITTGVSAQQQLQLSSPDGTLSATLTSGQNGLQWSLHRNDRTLIEPSPLGITIDGTDYGSQDIWGTPSLNTIRESYLWRGVKSTATNHCHGYSIPVTHGTSARNWTLEAKVFNDGFAYRYRIPGKASRIVRSERSSWTFPEKTTLWFQTDTRNYEGEYHSASPHEIPLTTGGDSPATTHLGAPATAQLPDGSLLLITEANLRNYSGISLKPTGTSRIKVAFEDDPSGFQYDGEILTPWRVTVAADDLNALVNTDVIRNLADPPNPNLFPDGAHTTWIKPGRALITWCVFGNDGAQWHLQKWFVDQCAALHCEYLLVDGGWRTEQWGYLSGGADLWARLKEICAYASQRNVKIIVWTAFPEGRNDGPGLTDPVARRDFFGHCRKAGVKGIKVDFFDSESRETLAAYEDLARLAAENQMLINFHGANKPTGESRTWPNEVSREGIREQEYLLWQDLPLEHYTALPFTRMIVGDSDFLPTYVRPEYLKNTTATFQMATAVIATSSFLCWPDHPDYYLASPFLGLIQAMPLVWDETHVLPGSQIGNRVGFARRSGDTWLVGILNGTQTAQDWTVNLNFLGDGEFFGTLYSDAAPHPQGVHVETSTTLTKDDHLQATLAPGGGYTAWIKPLQKP
jgi:alpha-glucosidase